MEKQVYEVDEEGYLKEIYVEKIDENGNILNESLKHLITLDIPQGFYRPKWDINKWVEGESVREKADREAQQLLDSLKPSPSEIANAELEIKFITMLTELEVI
ncbi:hypothetical protein P9436_11155 [Lysinibacillus capsici]|uniref:hypothetical protein n=1 Tax=Lysinibacillus capsici TaxID=2115968 RepID=UPI002E1D3DCF|nr:hypothetical protein [Lysinibacillus capsici]